MSEYNDICERIQWELAGLDPGEVLPVEAQRHLEVCAACGTVAEELALNAGLMAALREEAVAAPEIEVATEPPVVIGRRQGGLRRFAAVAAMFVIGIALWALIGTRPVDGPVEVATVSGSSDSPVASSADAEPVVEAAQQTSAEAVPSRNPIEEPLILEPREVVARVAEPLPVTPEPAFESDVDPEIASVEARQAVEAPLPLPDPFAVDFTETRPVETTVVKILTPDPDVVIYWLVDMEPTGGAGSTL